MFSPMLSVYLIPFVSAMFLAINMGASGTAPSFAPAYGANLLRKEFIPGLFGTFVFLGAIIAGKKVVLTIGGGILPADIITLSLTTVILLSIAISLLIANLLKVPQSTSQSTIFALIGPAVHFKILQTHKLFFEIIPAWFILPIVSFVVTFFIGRFIYKPIKRNGLINFEMISAHWLLKLAVIAACCYVAFAIGSNNVANAAGPIVAMVTNRLDLAMDSGDALIVIILATLVVSPCFGIGSSLLGHRVLETTGKEIVKFGPLGGTLISFVTATLLLVASVTRGIPTSLVQMNTAAIIGLGISKVGKEEILKSQSIKKLFTIWTVAPLIALLLSYSATLLLEKIGLL